MIEYAARRFRDFACGAECVFDPAALGDVANHAGGADE